MKVREDGCVICGATWGDYWEEVEGQRMFFCCDICAAEFKNMIRTVKERTGWKTLDEVEMSGNYRGRVCNAKLSENSFRFLIRFNDQGEVQSFVEMGRN